MPKISLVFVFNHRFERNVAKLETLYGDRFSVRHYLMPFATSPHPQVIPVMENGFTFSGHLAQGARGYLDPEVTHYIFLGDDLIVNPRLNEDNILSTLGVADGESYIKSLAGADPFRYRWLSSVNGSFSLLRTGFDYKSELPPAAEAKARFEEMGMRFGLPRLGMAEWKWALRRARKLPFWFMRLLAMRKRESEYPLLAGYSDFVIVAASAVHDFVRYCGVFAAMNMFAEMAVPTALALATTDIKTELLRGEHFAFPEARRNPQATMEGCEMWDGGGEVFARDMKHDFGRLMSEFPADRLYVHPVKLSKWM